MKRKTISSAVVLATVFLVLSTLFLNGCALLGVPTREEMWEKCRSFYEDNKELFDEAAKTGDYSEIAKKNGVVSVEDSGNEWHAQEICLGSWGIVPSGGEYGIMISPDNVMCASHLCSRFDDSELTPTDDGGFKCTDDDGDNRYYVRKIDDGVFFYEFDT